VRFGRGDGGEPWMSYTLNYGLNLTEFIDERRREANLSTSRISFLFASTECRKSVWMRSNRGVRTFLRTVNL
jgi:hypothetical protein